MRTLLLCVACLLAWSATGLLSSVDGDDIAASDVDADADENERSETEDDDGSLSRELLAATVEVTKVRFHAQFPAPRSGYGSPPFRPPSSTRS